MSSIDVNGTRLYFEEHGSGPPILCIHGGGSTALMWADAFGDLARRGRVIAYDRRGCARSARPERYEHTTVSEQADDAAALLDALDAAPAVVIGRSYGGAVAIDLALRYPDRVRALVLLEGDALGLSSSGRAWTRRLRGHLQDVAARDGVDAVYEALIDDVVGEGVWDSLPAAVRQVLTNNGGALLAELHYVDEPLPGPAEISSIRQPTLLVAATGSPPPQQDMTAALAATLPDSRSTVVAGGHLVDPASPAVLAFLDEMLGFPDSQGPLRA